MFFEKVICKRGIPDNITSNRREEFISRFWNGVCSHLSVNQCLSTAFHLHTVGQTERQYQTMEQYLEAFSNDEQDYLVEMFLRGDFAYNNCIHLSTLMTPVWAHYYYHPTMQFKPPKGPRI